MDEIKNISQKLVRATRPIDFFGEIKSEKELKKIYHDTAKKIHPDLINGKGKYEAEQAFQLLYALYEKGIEELKSGIYSIIDTISLYERQTPLFTFDIDDITYKFYEYFCEGEIAHIYKGTDGKNVCYLKSAIDENDNVLIDNEFEVLNNLNHPSLPIIENYLTINGLSSIILRESKGIPAPQLLDQLNGRIPDEHVMWILERLLSVVGYLHSNYVVHGNMKPEHIIVNPDNHNVSLLGFGMCIKDANKPDSKYKIINEYYTAPEVNKNTSVMPNTDIYALGKIVIKLLGGNIVNNAMPIHINEEIRAFIRSLVNTNPNIRPNDAWQLWNELIELRTKVYGTERFKKLEKKL